MVSATCLHHLRSFKTRLFKPNFLNFHCFLNFVSFRVEIVSTVEMRVNDTVAIHLLSRFDGRLRTLCVSHSQREEDGGNISSSQTGERPPSFTRYGIPGVLEILFSSPPKF